MDLSISTDCLTPEESQQIEAKVAELNHAENLRTHYEIRPIYDEAEEDFTGDYEGFLLIQTDDIVHPDLNEEALQAFFDELDLTFDLNPATDFADAEYDVSLYFSSEEAAKGAAKELLAIFGDRRFDVPPKHDEEDKWDISDKVKAGDYEKLLDWLRGRHPELMGVYVRRQDFQSEYDWADRNYFHQAAEDLISWQVGDEWLD